MAYISQKVWPPKSVAIKNILLDVSYCDLLQLAIEQLLAILKRQRKVYSFHEFA